MQSRLPLSQRIKAVADIPLKWRPRVPAEVPPFRVFGVYSHRNGELLARLVKGQDPQTVHLWTLDEPHQLLADRTLGAGPGGKFDLVDRLLEMKPPAPAEYVVVIEDDIALVRGSLELLVQLSHAAGFELAQAAHDRRGFVNYGLTVSRPAVRARRTTFVEIGPLLVISPDRRDDIIPAGGTGMGYGLERCWYNLEPPPRMGVVDEVRIRHLAPTGRAYDQRKALREMEALWRRRGVVREQPQQTLEQWRAWRSIPPWMELDRRYG